MCYYVYIAALATCIYTSIYAVATVSAQCDAADMTAFLACDDSIAGDVTTDVISAGGNETTFHGSTDLNDPAEAELFFQIYSDVVCRCAMACYIFLLNMYLHSVVLIGAATVVAHSNC